MEYEKESRKDDGGQIAAVDPVKEQGKSAEQGEGKDDGGMVDFCKISRPRNVINDQRKDGKKNRRITMLGFFSPPHEDQTSDGDHLKDSRNHPDSGISRTVVKNVRRPWQAHPNHIGNHDQDKEEQRLPIKGKAVIAQKEVHIR